MCDLLCHPPIPGRARCRRGKKRKAEGEGEEGGEDEDGGAGAPAPGEAGVPAGRQERLIMQAGQKQFMRAGGQAGRQPR